MTKRNVLDLVPKDYRSLVDAALEAGWEVSKSRHGHLKLSAPDGYSTPIPGSSNSGGLRKQIANRLRKRGVDV